jgi:Microtubule-binding stalk of dynein motor
LEEEVGNCRRKLERAAALTGGLADEKLRWADVAALLASNYVTLTGDVLLAAAFIAYLGAYGPFFENCVSVEEMQTLIPLQEWHTSHDNMFCNTLEDSYLQGNLAGAQSSLDSWQVQLWSARDVELIVQQHCWQCQ